jgi:predicted oxidoreductase (fatty acid repression mutant protein)
MKGKKKAKIKTNGKKASNQVGHIKQRFVERFGISLSNEDISSMISQIQKQTATFIRRQSHRVSIWQVPLQDRLFEVVYDKRTKTVVTVLPELSRDL